MTKDLEETLSTLDGAHREMVVRMKSCFAPAPAFAVRRRPSSGALAAAMAAVAACGIVAALWWSQSPAEPHLSAFRLASVGNAEAVAEILRTQNADGSWQTDFLTRQNARLLASVDSADAALARRRALRNLRARGLAGL